MATDMKAKSMAKRTKRTSVEPKRVNATATRDATPAVVKPAGRRPDNVKRIQNLAKSFPSLAGSVGVTPWDPDDLAK